MSDDGHTGADRLPRVLLSDRQDAAVDSSSLLELAETVLGSEGHERSELSVSFVTEEEMAALHVQYLDEEGPTDVLSFPLDDLDEDGVRMLGDVVIAPSVAARNNPDANAEMRLLLVHGILHLLGHDHEEDEERVAMWALQERYTGVRVP